MISVGDWPQLGNTARDGSRFIGRDMGNVRTWAQRGVVVVNKLFARTVTPAVASVRVDDVLEVQADGDYFYLYGSELLGRLTLTRSSLEAIKSNYGSIVEWFATGTLEVTRLQLSPAGAVINCGGLVRPVR